MQTTHRQRTFARCGFLIEDKGMDRHAAVRFSEAGFRGLLPGRQPRARSGLSLSFQRADFVPGEVNRLTDYVEADAFTHQSLIKRTPVQLLGLRPLETRLWAMPDAATLAEATERLFADWRSNYPEDEDWITTQRDAPDAKDWLASDRIRDPKTREDERIGEAVGAMTAFFQRYGTDDTYRTAAGPILHDMRDPLRDRFLRILLPLIRRFDYHSVLHKILSDFVGSVTVLDGDGAKVELNLLSAHKSAVLEFKEEIVAIQLFIAAKRGLELLYGPGAVVPREDLAFVSGVAIPCAGDVPAHFLGISPADLGQALLVHSRAIGNSALIVVDRRKGRAVRVDVITGVLPKDRELTRLRGAVINRKRAASTSDHRRFFDRLGELIVDYVRTGDGNFQFDGPVSMDWSEYQAKLSFSPAYRRGFVDHLVKNWISPELAEAFVGLGILDPEGDAKALEAIRTADPFDASTLPVFDEDRLADLRCAEMRAEPVVAIRLVGGEDGVARRRRGVGQRSHQHASASRARVATSITVSHVMSS